MYVKKETEIENSSSSVGSAKKSFRRSFWVAQPGIGAGISVKGFVGGPTMPEGLSGRSSWSGNCSTQASPLLKRPTTFLRGNNIAFPFISVHLASSNNPFCFLLFISPLFFLSHLAFVVNPHALPLLFSLRLNFLYPPVPLVSFFFVSPLILTTSGCFFSVYWFLFALSR